MKKYYLLTIVVTIIAFSSFAQTKGTFKDSRDGKTYKTVKIGNQTWMAENLAYKPSNGEYWVCNNNISNIAKMGYLYRYETATTACPSGWHLPTDSEWNTIQVSNDFSVIYSGMYNKFSKKFFVDGAYWWSSTVANERAVYLRYLAVKSTKIERAQRIRIHGMAVRCIKD